MARPDPGQRSVERPRRARLAGVAAGRRDGAGVVLLVGLADRVLRVHGRRELALALLQADLVELDLALLARVQAVDGRVDRLAAVDGELHGERAGLRRPRVLDDDADGILPVLAV